MQALDNVSGAFFMRKLILIASLIISVAGRSQSAPSKPFMEGNYRYLSVGYSQFDKGSFSLGMKWVKWKDVVFSSAEVSYGFNPWLTEHSAIADLDVTLYFTTFGLQTTAFTRDGEQFNVSFRPYLGVYFVYGALYFGPHLWVNNNNLENRNRWAFNVEFNIPIFRN